jgi:hypothetical protein
MLKPQSEITYTLAMKSMISVDLTLKNCVRRSKGAVLTVNINRHAKANAETPKRDHLHISHKKSVVSVDLTSKNCARCRAVLTANKNQYAKTIAETPKLGSLRVKHEKNGKCRPYIEKLHALQQRRRTHNE